MNKMNWQGQKVVVLGAARQGIALARYLANHGVNVILNDRRNSGQPSPDLDELQALGVELVFGSHPLELLDNAQALCLSGGIPLNLPIVQQALRMGIPLSNDSQVFMDTVPCKVIGITGSAGKSTTTTLVGRMAEASHTGKVWIGGNLGLPLISLVDNIQPEDLVVMELSSFQLEQMTSSPHIAAVLNITPNHLDRHGTMSAYTAAKARILQYQKSGDIAVLNREEPGSWELRSQVQGELHSFGLGVPTGQYIGTSFKDGWIHQSDGKHEEKLMPREMVLLKGEHNLANVLAACAISSAAGISQEAMIKGVAGFTGIAHRLELVRVFHGAVWYNDLIATTPERTMAAIRSFQEPLILLLGGRDKNLPWQDLAELIGERVKHVVLFGEAAPMIENLLREIQNSGGAFTLHTSTTLEDAVLVAADIAEAGDVVLLSPGCTSFDAFKDFEERGEQFRLWVNKLS